MHSLLYTFLCYMHSSAQKRKVGRSYLHLMIANIHKFACYKCLSFLKQPSNQEFSHFQRFKDTFYESTKECSPT